MTIFEKVTKYDAEHGTNFVVMIGDKIANPEGDYYNGILHGLLLALAHLGVITKDEAVELLESRLERF